ncbi:MAG: transporter [Salinibacterium sp.]|nr:transporter [Salinibacterium sp.]
MTTTGQRIPLNTLAIAFGLAGLAGAWSAAVRLLGVPAVVAEGLWIVASIAWVWLIAAHLARGFRSTESAADQLRHPVQGPIAALVPLVGMLLGAHLHRLVPLAGTVLVIASIVAVALLAGWMLSFWVRGGLKPESLHPGYLLPTVGGGLVASLAATSIGLPAVAMGAFAVGIFFWLAIFPLLLARLAVLPALPGPLTPTLAILIAPPVVAGSAWFAVMGERDDPISQSLLALTVVMLLLQLALVPRYLRLTFSLGFWSFTFPFSATAVYGIEWLSVVAFPGWQLFAWLLLAVVTVLIVGISIRSLVLVGGARRGSREAERELVVADDALG